MIIENGPYCVYYHENKINGKIYVGISKDVKERWRGQGKNYRESCKFNNAIKKYGWDGFHHIIFADHLTREEACNMEKTLIDKLQTRDDKYGYNMTEGGDAFNMTDEMKDKLRELAHERFFGVKFSEEHSKKISNARTFYSGCVPGKRAVRCIETGEEFDSVMSAAKILDIPHSSISHVLIGRRKSTHNLHFEYIYPQNSNDYPRGVGCKRLASEMAEAA